MILRRLSSEAWQSSKMHADHFINDCGNVCKGFIIVYMSSECNFCIYVAFVTEGHMVE